MKIRIFNFYLFSIFLSISCQTNTTKKIAITEIATPAADGASTPNLVLGDDSELYLSWTEPDKDAGHALRFAKHARNGWGNPVTVAAGDNWFVNWADFPSLVAFADGSLAAHWLAKSGSGTYAYNVNIGQSLDGGDTWQRPVVPHRDGTETEHGFVSMLPWDDELFVVWLDGRKFANKSNGHGSGTNEMTLRYALIDKNGEISNETVLDSRVCDCCPTSAVRTANGAVVVYRDRSENEVRDISIVRLVNGKWSKPRVLFNDGWEIAGCPVNGPAIAANNNSVAAAWFTWANDTARVKLAFSDDEGENFTHPIIVDDGEPIGRVDAVLLPDGSALVSWMESVGNNAELRVRRVYRNGAQDESVVVTPSSKERASGMPRMINKGNEVFFAWTEPGKPSIVRTATATVR